MPSAERQAAANCYPKMVASMVSIETGTQGEGVTIEGVEQQRRQKDFLFN